MTRHYCTLFDQTYLAKGLTMIRSLQRHSSEPFRLHVIAMDDVTLAVLRELDIPEISAHPIAPFEAEMGLTKARSDRSWQEYCWTCASCSVEYVLRWMHPDTLTYLDADLFFFSDPKAIHDAVGSRSIGITPHRFPEDRRFMERNGKFNVGVVTFRFDGAGLACSSRWAKQCRRWCYARNENGLFGDQAYLDEWPELYGDDVAIIENIGINAAPWNIGQYEVHAGMRVGDAPFLTFRETLLHGLGRTPLVCYHLHEYEHGVRLTNYKISEEVMELIYRPYVAAYIDADSTLAGARDRLQKRQQATAARAELA